MSVMLRWPTVADEDLVNIMRAEFEADGFGQAMKPGEGQTWHEWVSLLPAWSEGRDLPDQHVPFEAFIAEADGEAVGYVSFRHNLQNETLRNWGGHIGYVVRPKFRRRGYATAMLRETLKRAKALGLDRVMVSCDERNAASARVIEKCGGIYESSFEHDDKVTRRYWIDLAV